MPQNFTYFSRIVQELSGSELPVDMLSGQKKPENITSDTKK